MFYLLYICWCLIVRWEIHFNESLCFIETSPLISSVHDLTRFCLMWVFTEFNLWTHLKAIFILCVSFYKPAFDMSYLIAMRSFNVDVMNYQESFHLFSIPVSLAQWRGEIGVFYINTLTFCKISTFYLLLSLSYRSIFCSLHLIRLPLLIIRLILNGIMFLHFFKKCRNNNLKIGVYLFTTIYLLIISNLLEYLWVASRIISLSGDIEINPGLKSNALDSCFSICHWNLNSTSTHTFTKVSFLSASISVHKFDIICLSETYLISKIPSDDENLEIVGYNLVREDRPSNSKHGGFCVYY